MTETPEKPPSEKSLQLGYEPPGVNNLGLLIFFVIFILVAVGLQFGLWGLLKVYLHEPRPADVVTSASPPQPRFKAPHLQPTQQHDKLPSGDLDDLRREKNEIFQGMGWSLDPQSGAPVIPDSIVDELAKQRNHPQTAPSGGQR